MSRRLKERIIKPDQITTLQDQRGFTLIEALIGVLLLTIVAFGVLTGVSTSLSTGAIADKQSQCISLAISQIESLQLQVYQDAPSNGEVYYDEITVDPTGNYTIWSCNRYGDLVDSTEEDKGIVGVPWFSSAEGLEGEAITIDDGMQKIVLVIKQGDKEAFRIETYKVK